MQHLRAIPRDLALLATLVVGCVLVNLIWLYRFRWGYPTEWDESGYISIAVLDTHALQDGGPVSLLEMVQKQPVQAPLVPLVTVPFQLLFGVGVNQSLLAIPVFLALLLVATYGIARRLLSSSWALVAVLAVGTAPVVTDYTRLYHFSVPAAAWMAAAVWALLRSDRLRDRRFALLAGVCVGLMLLTRTMTVSYLPGIALAAAALIAPGGEVRRRAVNLGVAVLAAVAVAATWYAENWRGVYDYLFGFGYGSDAIRYGDNRSVLSMTAWKVELRTVVTDLYLPMAGVLLFAAAVFIVFAAGRPRSARRSLREWLGHPAVTLLLIAACGYLALVSSANPGTAFALPLLPLVVVLAVSAMARVPSHRVRAALMLAIAAVSVANLAMKSGLVPILSDSRNARVPVIGTVAVTDGTGIIQGQLAASGYAVSATERMPSFHRRWLATERELTSRIFAHAVRFGTEASGYLGTRNFLLANTTLRLAAALDRRYLPVGWLDADPDSPQAYSATLAESGARFLVVADSPASALPGVTPAKAEQAAASLGFRQVDTVVLPDGREARLWWRQT